MDFSDFDKPTVRHILAARRNALTETERAEAMDIILHRLLSLPAWRDAAVIGGFMATRGELDLLPVWQAACAAGKTYALPVTASGADEGRMIFRATPSFCPHRLVRGRFGIAEPPATSDFPPLSPKALNGALVLIPGLGFDREGYRIGYGGGYYDRFLDALSLQKIHIHAVGLCPAVCFVDRLPRMPHDRAVPTVIVEA